MVDVKIVREGDHYDVYVDGDFYSSADTYSEAAYDAEEIWREENLLKR